MTNARSIWEAYASAWKAAGADAKRTALARSVTADGVYRDPLAECPGHDALIAYMLEFHKQVPGGHFETTYFLAHHGRCQHSDAKKKALFHWEEGVLVERFSRRCRLWWVWLG